MDCDGKKSFDSPGLALIAARRKKCRRPYRCVECKTWHVANAVPHSAKALRKRKQ